MTEAKRTNKTNKLKKFSLKIWGLIVAVVVGGGVLSVLLGHYLEVKKAKKDLYIETKSICDQLNDDYKQLIAEKIELEFFRANSRKNLGGGACIPLDNPPVKRKPIDQCLLNVDEGRKKLLKKINEIELSFDINKDLEKELIHLRVSRFSDTLSFQKVRLSEIKNCNELRTWRAGAQKQGNVYLEKWFLKPYSRLLTGLKKQL